MTAHQFSCILHEKPGVVLLSRRNISKSNRSLPFKIRNNSRRKYKNFLYDHFIKYNHFIENVTITPVKILSKQPGDSKNYYEKTHTFGMTLLDKSNTDAISSLH